jgi:hypothetical protein
MKKTLKITTIIFLILTISFIKIIQINALSNINEKTNNMNLKTMNNDLFKSFQIAERFLGQYYSAEQKREETVFKNIFLYESLDIYIQMRLEKSRTVLFLESSELKKNLIGTNIKSTYFLEEFEFNKDGLYMRIFVEAEVQYSNQTENYKENGIEEIPTLNSNRWNLQKNSKAINEVITQIESNIITLRYTFAHIDEYIEESKRIAELETTKIEKNKNSILLEQKQTNKIESTKAMYSFNRTAMVNYAVATAPLRKHSDHKLYTDKNHTISARGSSQAPYYFDFSSFTNHYDCTNFISHVLLKGGAKMKKDGNPNPSEVNGGGWYFNNTNPTGPTSRSESWAGVNQFGTFLLYNTGNGPRGILRSNIAAVALGDIIQWKYGKDGHGHPNYGHTTVITGSYLTILPTGVYPLITHRSSNGFYEVNQRFHDKLTEGNVIGYRIIALSGYVY